MILTTLSLDYVFGIVLVSEICEGVPPRGVGGGSAGGAGGADSR